ncbi:ankyrin repeat-containing domain protein [Tricharina praecox]|uniref:ankyrin repeat-containing domain protein n=1 Tax=Tricharina praecox TaxID=43433 RepID=UPI00221E4835|nr:ankyrin repeat-containing domain protein [Tricharina praecox]KAI5849160.1 ankyrin repeat-containing domain protein [Tricharina praecox]
MALLRSVSVTEALDIVDRDGRNFLHLVAIQGLGKKALWLGEQLKSGLGSPKQPGLLSAQSVQPKTSPDHPSSSPDNSEQLKSAISTRDRDGRTPLHLAVLKGHKELVKMFLEWGADPNAKDSSQGTAIHFAAHYDRHEMIGLLVDKGALLKHHANLSASDDKWSALAFACSFGHVEAVKFLLEQGIEVDSRDLMRDTPLHNAASGGHDSVIRLLLEKGAEIQAGNNGLETPLHMACLHAKEVSTVRILLEHGADPNAHSLGTQCTTPLHIAAQNDSTEIVRLLLEKGADPNAKTEMIGWDALRLAQSVEVCEILIVAGADVKAISNSGFTQLAQSAGNLGKTKLLADHGVDFTRTGGPGNKGPISWAVAANDFYMARLAIEAGDDINRKDTETGGTPLHAAVQRKLFGMIKFLIKNGADKNVKNDNGETPWDLIRTAVFLGKHGWSDDIIRLLR